MYLLKLNTTREMAASKATKNTEEENYWSVNDNLNIESELHEGSM